MIVVHWLVVALRNQVKETRRAEQSKAASSINLLFSPLLSLARPQQQNVDTTTIDSTRFTTHITA
jgi:hypothetical protein